MNSEWIAVEEALPDLNEAVAIWLDDGVHQDLTFGRLAADRPAPLWRSEQGQVFGETASAWRVTHWSRKAVRS